MKELATTDFSEAWAERVDLTRETLALAGWRVRDGSSVNFKTKEEGTRDLIKQIYVHQNRWKSVSWIAKRCTASTAPCFIISHPTERNSDRWNPGTFLRALNFTD